jgi:hypothetical protein
VLAVPAEAQPVEEKEAMMILSLNRENHQIGDTGSTNESVFREPSTWLHSKY